MARTYLVAIQYQHKGTRYDRSMEERIEASTAAAAGGKALRGLRKATGFRDIAGGVVTLRITNLGNSTA